MHVVGRFGDDVGSLVAICDEGAEIPMNLGVVLLTTSVLVRG